MSNTATGKKDGRRQERNRVKSKPKDGWNEEHADSWWKDEQTGSSSSAGWWTANDQTLREPEGPVGVRVSSGAVIPNLGKIKMKSTDEGGVAMSIRSHITEFAKPLLSAAELSRRWDSSLRGRRNPCETKFSCCFGGPSNFEKHKVWNRHGKSIRLYREGNLYKAYVRAGDVIPELAPVEPAEESWTRAREMDVDGGDHDDQDEADQPKKLRRVSAARQPTELERQKHFQTNDAVFAPWCEVCVKAKGNRSTTQETDNQGIGKTRTG